MHILNITNLTNTNLTKVIERCKSINDDIDIVIIGNTAVVNLPIPNKVGNIIVKTDVLFNVQINQTVKVKGYNISSLKTMFPISVLKINDSSLDTDKLKIIDCTHIFIKASQVISKLTTIKSITIDVNTNNLDFIKFLHTKSLIFNIRTLDMLKKISTINIKYKHVFKYKNHDIDSIPINKNTNQINCSLPFINNDMINEIINYKCRIFRLVTKEKIHLNTNEHFIKFLSGCKVIDTNIIFNNSGRVLTEILMYSPHKKITFISLFVTDVNKELISYLKVKNNWHQIRLYYIKIDEYIKDCKEFTIYKHNHYIEFYRNKKINLLSKLFSQK